MWKTAAVLILVIVAGATAHAQQQQSAIETLGKTMSDLAREGYEIKAAEDLSGDLPKIRSSKSGEHRYLLNKFFRWGRKLLSPQIEGKVTGVQPQSVWHGAPFESARSSVASGPVDARASRS